MQKGRNLPQSMAFERSERADHRGMGKGEREAPPDWTAKNARPPLAPSDLPNQELIFQLCSLGRFLLVESLTLCQKSTRRANGGEEKPTSSPEAAVVF